jgi:hypothetical protein
MDERFRMSDPPVAPIRSNTFLQRLMGAAALDPAIYEEVEADADATTQACLVVVLSSLAAGIGARGFGEQSIANIGYIGIASLLLWAAWALVTFEIRARLLPGNETRADVGQLLRTIGFAAAPGMLRVFGILPEVAVPAFVIGWIWMLLAMVVAVRHALDYQSTWRAVAVCALGWLLAVAVAIVLGLAWGPKLY